MGHSLQLWSEAFASSSRWTRPCFSQRKIDANINSGATLPDGTPVPISRSCFNAPTIKPEPFWPVFSARNVPEFRAKKPVTRCLDRRTEWSIWNPSGDDRRDPNTLAPNKLRQLRYARQGLVRVPESNTKYGGKRRKTGVASAPLCRQVSVSPQGFPSKKNCFERANFSFVPLFTGQLFIVAEGLPRRDSGVATACPGWHARPRMAWRPDNRHGAADSTGPTPS